MFTANMSRARTLRPALDGLTRRSHARRNARLRLIEASSPPRPWKVMLNYRREKKVIWFENNCIEGQ